MFLNIHTHYAEKHESEQIIYNLIIPESAELLENFPQDTPNSWLSVGIHPWSISETDHELQLEKLRQLAYNQQVKFIGECGLDRLKGVGLVLQEEIFIKQIRIAEEAKKPILIHCVKCFNELVSIKKVVRPKVPMVVHGFNNNIEIAQSLLERGFYLSLGAALMNDESNAVKVLQQIPTEKLFLETDDKEIPIKDIYQKAANLRNIPLAVLEEIIFSNYLSVTLQ